MKRKTEELDFELLEKKLDGIYDFNDIADCQSVIRILVRDLRNSRMQAEKNEQDLKMLALLVSNKREKQAAGKAKEVLVGSKPKTNIIDYLKRMSGSIKDAMEMDDTQLLDEVTNRVWADLDYESIESAVLEELMHRYNKVKTNKEQK